MIRRGFRLALCLVLVASVVAASGAAAENWADQAVRQMVDASLRNLPPGTTVAYDSLTPDIKGHTFTINGLRFSHKDNTGNSQGTVGLARLTGVDIVAILSGQPFTARRIELSRLHITQTFRPRGRPPKNHVWSLGRATIDGGSMPPILPLLQGKRDPREVMGDITFKDGSIDGRAVHTVAEVMKRVQTR
ncbi:MAG: hypothetical protein HQL37_07360 [Alphaproteobacteria bacterium]|nr:hypothetical protein [Alphaproteobacteria bacterium]